MIFRTLLRVTATIEAGTALALLLLPRLIVSLLFGQPPGTPLGLLLARFVGVPLLSLGLACWWASLDPASRVALGLVTAMLLYNVAVTALLVYARVSPGLSGIAFWPAIIVHTVLAVWCLAGFVPRTPAHQ
jgi:hypothetical protein